jgi:predicted nucleotidyltransferase
MSSIHGVGAGSGACDDAYVASIPAPIADSLSHFKRALTSELGGRVRKLVLFGSVARGEHRWDSDVDVLVVLDRMTVADQDRVLELAGDEWVQGALISPTVMSQEHYDRLIAHERRFARDIAREGIPL